MNNEEEPFATTGAYKDVRDRRQAVADTVSAVEKANGTPFETFMSSNRAWQGRREHEPPNVQMRTW